MAACKFSPLQQLRLHPPSWAVACGSYHLRELNHRPHVWEAACGLHRPYQLRHYRGMRNSRCWFREGLSHADQCHSSWFATYPRQGCWGGRSSCYIQRLHLQSLYQPGLVHHPVRRFKLGQSNSSRYLCQHRAWHESHCQGRKCHSRCHKSRWLCSRHLLHWLAESRIR